MTPYEIEILLFYYTRAGDHPTVFENPPIWRETAEKFLSTDLLVARDTGTEAYGLTERGRVYCESLTRVPLPEPQWVTRWATDTQGTP